jgi:hypothetical protein
MYKLTIIKNHRTGVDREQLEAPCFQSLIGLFYNVEIFFISNLGFLPGGKFYDLYTSCFFNVG